VGICSILLFVSLTILCDFMFFRCSRSTARSARPREPSFTTLKTVAPNPKPNVVTSTAHGMGAESVLPEPLAIQGDLESSSAPVRGLERRSWLSGLDADGAAMKRLSLELNSLRMSGLPLEPVTHTSSVKPLTPGVAAADADLLQWLDDCDLGDLGIQEPAPWPEPALPSSLN